MVYWAAAVEASKIAVNNLIMPKLYPADEFGTLVLLKTITSYRKIRTMRDTTRGENRMRYPPAYHRAMANMATDAQWSYVSRLLNQAFSRRIDHGLGLDANHRPHHYTKQQASADIERLKELLAR